MDFDGSCANAEFIGDNLIRLPFEQSRQHLRLPHTQRREPLLNHTRLGVRRLFTAFPDERLANGSEKSVAIERFLEKIDRPLSHRRDRERNIAMRGHDDDR